METATAAPPRPNLTLIRHQAQVINAPWNKQVAGIDCFIHVAGYASGKTFGDCALALNLVRRYHAHEVSIGIGATSQIFLKKTLLNDLFRLFNRFGIPYDFNAQTGIIQVDRMQFMCIGTEQPDLIYGYNYHAFINDEIDELPHQKALDSRKAISERTRLVFPDGRQPFELYSSTAQGYKGLYQIVSEMQEKGEPHVLIRGETIAAVKAGILSRKKYDSWVRMYNENERLAFLEGRFVNLNTGRVYYDYDDDMNRMKVEPFRVQSDDVIHVGQDLNTGYSMGTAYVKRIWNGRPRLFVVAEWSFPNIGHAPKIMRQAFRDNEICWYPDASGREIMAGYKAEIREQDIEMRLAKRNPSRVDRIFVMNKMFHDQLLFLFPHIKRLSMALKVRQYDDKGDAEKGKGPDAPDHPCDSAEYAAWRIVRMDPDFEDIYSATRMGRNKVSDSEPVFINGMFQEGETDDGEN
jgi:hypothetical protein